MEERIILDMLTPHSVSVKRQQYTTINGIEYDIGDPWRRTYLNSESGRLSVQSDLPQAQQNAIFALWGDTPTVTEVDE